MTHRAMNSIVEDVVYLIEFIIMKVIHVSIAYQAFLKYLKKYLHLEELVLVFVLKHF